MKVLWWSGNTVDVLMGNIYEGRIVPLVPERRQICAPQDLIGRKIERVSSNAGRGR